MKECPQCSGSGEVEMNAFDEDPNEPQTYFDTCVLCGGKGEIKERSEET